MLKSKFGAWAWDLHTNNGTLNRIPLQLHSQESQNQITVEQERQLITVILGGDSNNPEFYPVDPYLINIKKFAKCHPGCIYIYGDEPKLDSADLMEAYVNSYITYMEAIKGEDSTARLSPAGTPAPFEYMCYVQKEFWTKLKAKRPNDYGDFIHEWRFNMQLRTEDAGIDGWYARMDKIVQWRAESGEAERPVVVTIGSIDNFYTDNFLTIQNKMMEYLQTQNSFDFAYWYSLDLANDSLHLYDFQKDQLTPVGEVFMKFFDHSPTTLLMNDGIAIPIK